MFILESRASSILYHFLVSNKSPYPFILPANICPIVPVTFFKAGQSFLFVDIDPATYSLDEHTSLEMIEHQNIGGVLFVHSYGEPAPHADFFSSLRKTNPNIKIIDDRCLCEPDLLEPGSKDVDLTLYSTGYGKYVDAGFGGFGWLKPGIPYQQGIIPFYKSDLDNLDQSYKAAIQHKSVFHYQDSHWLDTRPVEIDFQIFAKQIHATLEDIQKSKIQINQIYRDQLPSEIQFPDMFNQWRFNIQVSNKNGILKSLFDHQLFASSHYASLGGIMAEGKYPHAENLHDHIINLFNDRHYSAENAQKTVDLIIQNLQ